MNRQELIERLKSINRYYVYECDDGDGYTSEIEDIDPEGDWVRSSDIDDIIKGV